MLLNLDYLGWKPRVAVGLFGASFFIFQAWKLPLADPELMLSVVWLQ